MRFIISFLIVMCFAHMAIAQDYRPFSQINDIPEYFDEMRNRVEANFSGAKGVDGNFQKPLSESEKRQGLIPIQDMKRITDRGTFSAYALWCGFDWQDRSYLAFMKQERASGRWKDRQLAYIGMMHGVSMGYMENIMKKRGEDCTPADKKKVASYFDYLEGK